LKPWASEASSPFWRGGDAVVEIVEGAGARDLGGGGGARQPLFVDQLGRCGQ
jgi:hypothetical protein